MNRFRFLVGLAALAVWLALVGPPRLRVSYHQLARTGDIFRYYEHGRALLDLAVAGNRRALVALLSPDGCDGANTYTQHNLSVMALAQIPDEQVALAVDELAEIHRERLRYFMTSVSDLERAAPRTFVALGRPLADSSSALPLRDPRNRWP